PTGKVPGIWKARALARFHWLNAAVTAFEEDAFVIVGAIGRWSLVDECEAIALRAQAGVALDEIVLPHPEKAGDRGYFRFLEADEARPAATLGATLALVVDDGLHRR